MVKVMNKQTMKYFYNTLKKLTRSFMNLFLLKNKLCIFAINMELDLLKSTCLSIDFSKPAIN